MLYRRSANELCSAIVAYGETFTFDARYKRRRYSLGLCSQKAFLYQVLYECMVTLPRRTRLVAQQVRKQCNEFDSRELQFVPLTSLPTLALYSQARDLMLFLRYHLHSALQRGGVILKGVPAEGGEAERKDEQAGEAKPAGSRQSPEEGASSAADAPNNTSYSLDAYSSRPGLPFPEVVKGSQHLAPRGGWGPKREYGPLLPGPALHIPSNLLPQVRPEPDMEALEVGKLKAVERLYNVCTYLLLELRPALLDVHGLISWRLKAISRRLKLSKLQQGGAEGAGKQYTDLCLSLSVSSKMATALRASERYEREMEKFCSSGREMLVRSNGSIIIMLKNSPNQAERMLTRSRLLTLRRETKMNPYVCLRALGYSFVPPASLPSKNISILPWGVAISLKAVVDYTLRGMESDQPKGAERFQITQRLFLDKTTLEALEVMLQHFRRRISRRPFSALFYDVPGCLNLLFPEVSAYSDGDAERERLPPPSFCRAMYDVVLAELKLRLDNNYIVGYSSLLETVGADAAEQLSLWFEKSYTPAFITERAIERQGPAANAAKGVPTAASGAGPGNKPGPLPGEDRDDLLASLHFEVSGPDKFAAEVQKTVVDGPVSVPSSGAPEAPAASSALAPLPRPHARFANRPTRPSVGGGNPAFQADPYIDALQGLTSPQRKGGRGFSRAFERDYLELQPESPTPAVDERFQIMVRTGDLDAARRRLDNLMQEVLSSGPPAISGASLRREGTAAPSGQEGFVPPPTAEEKMHMDESALGKSVLDLSVALLTKRVIGLRAALEGSDFGSERSPPLSEREGASLEESERVVSDLKHGFAVLKLETESPEIWAERAQALNSHETQASTELRSELAAREVARAGGRGRRSRVGGEMPPLPVARPAVSPLEADRRANVTPLSYTFSSKPKPGHGLAERDKAVSSFLPAEAGMSQGTAYAVRRLMTPAPDEVTSQSGRSGGHSTL